MNSFFRRIHRKSRPVDEGARPLELDAALHSALDGERSHDDADVQRALARDAAQSERFAEVSAAIAQLEQPIHSPDLSKSILDAVEARRPFAMGPVAADGAPVSSRRGRKRLSGARFAILGGALALVSVVVLLDRIPAPAGNALRHVSRSPAPSAGEPPRPIAAAAPSTPTLADPLRSWPEISPPERAYTALTLGAHSSRYEISAPFLPGTAFTSANDSPTRNELPLTFVWNGPTPPPLASQFPLRPATPNARTTPTHAATIDDLLTPRGEFWWRELRERPPEDRSAPSTGGK